MCVEKVEAGTVPATCKVCLTAARTGVVAIGKEATGQSSQSDAPFVSVIPVAEDATHCLFVSALERSHIKMHAANSHSRQSGMNAATARLILVRFLSIVGEYSYTELS